MRNALIAAVAACTVLAAAPSFAATASNSQNGTQSSNPNATDSPPTSASAVPATPMQMGTQPGTMQMQIGATTNGGAGGTSGTMSNGAGVTNAPKQ